jgi:hypothetical protein
MPTFLYSLGGVTAGGQKTEALECGIGNAEMEFAECLIHIIFHIPHSDFRIPVTRNPQRVTRNRDPDSQFKSNPRRITWFTLCRYVGKQYIPRSFLPSDRKVRRFPLSRDIDLARQCCFPEQYFLDARISRPAP